MNFSAVSQIERVMSTQIQKVLLINNGANSIYVLFWSSAPSMILFSIVEPLSKGKQTHIWQNEKKEHFMVRKRVFQIQHGCLDSTLYLGHCFSAATVIEEEGKAKSFFMTYSSRKIILFK